LLFPFFLLLSDHFGIMLDNKDAPDLNQGQGTNRFKVRGIQGKQQTAGTDSSNGR
jgi:hypothetical protein